VAAQVAEFRKISPDFLSRKVKTLAVIWRRIDHPQMKSFWKQISSSPLWRIIGTCFTKMPLQLNQVEILVLDEMDQRSSHGFSRRRSIQILAELPWNGKNILLLATMDETLERFIAALKIPQNSEWSRNCCYRPIEQYGLSIEAEKKRPFFTLFGEFFGELRHRFWFSWSSIRTAD